MKKRYARYCIGVYINGVCRESFNSIRTKNKAFKLKIYLRIEYPLSTIIIDRIATRKGERGVDKSWYFKYRN